MDLVTILPTHFIPYALHLNIHPHMHLHLHLKLHLSRRSWCWLGLFPLLPSPSLEVRFLCVELLRLLFSLPKASSQALWEQLLGREEQQEVASLVIKYRLEEVLAARSLALDTPQAPALALQEEAGVRLEHLSLMRSGQEGEACPLVEVASTLASLVGHESWLWAGPWRWGGRCRCRVTRSSGFWPA